MNPVAASDLLLALACMAAIALLRGRARTGSTAMITGWVLLGIAAFVGGLRYALWPQLESGHRLLSDLAAGLGLPAVACGLLLALRVPARITDVSLLAALVVVFVCAAIAGVPRVPGMAIALVASCAVALTATGAARGAAVLALLALLIGGGFSRGVPQPWAIGGLHLALAVAQLAWVAVGRRARAGYRMQGMRSAQPA